MAYKDKRNGAGHAEAQNTIWRDEDHVVQDWTVTCPSCGHDATYLANAYEPLVCTACSHVFG